MMNSTTKFILTTSVLILFGLNAAAEVQENPEKKIYFKSEQVVDPVLQKQLLRSMHPEAATVLRFWFEEWEDDMVTRGKGQFNQKWFPNGPDGVMGSRHVDQIITKKFAGLFNQAVNGGLDWDIEHNPFDNLAYILLIDQFSRHIHRGTPEAYANDALGLKAARTNVGNGFYRYYFTGYQKLFVVAPLVHHEDLTSQQQALVYLKQLNEDPQHPYEFLSVLRSAMDHYQMILMFGRFPHRNPRQGRTDTLLETAYLSKQGSDGFIDGSKW